MSAAPRFQARRIPVSVQTVGRPSAPWLWRPSPLALAVALGAASPAIAADVDVSSARTTPIATATADNGGAANIKVSSSVVVDTGTAVTVNSSNTLTNTGTIGSKAQSNGVAIHVNTAGNITGTITNEGSVYVTGEDSDDNPGTANVGILIDGGGTLTGDVTFDSTASVVVGGDDSRGVSLTATMIGDMTLYGVSTTGERSRAVSISGTLDGDLTLRGSLSSAGADGYVLYVDGGVTGKIYTVGTLVGGTDVTYDSDGNTVDAVPGLATVRLAGNVAGGFHNDSYYVDSDGDIVADADVDTSKHSRVYGTIQSLGGGYALQVAPGSTATADVVIGNVGTGDLAYGIVNEGSIIAYGRNAGTAATAVRVSGTTVSGTLYRAYTGGGLLNDSKGVIYASGVDATTTAISIGNGGVAPAIVNKGTITAITSQEDDDTTGGDAIGLHIEAGGSVTSFTNSGTIVATATGADQDAYVIRDQSGSLTAITNSGTMTAVAGDGATIAIDVSASTGGVSVTNSGTITGDVILGGGNDSLTLTDGTLTGDVDLRGGTNSLTLSGDAVLTGGVVSTGGALALSMSGTSVLDLTDQGTLNLASLDASGTSEIKLSVSADQTGIVVAGNATISDDAMLTAVFKDVVTDSATITLVSAGSLTVENPDTAVRTTTVPYMYAIDSLDATSTTLALQVHRKSATELGLVTPVGNLYEASIGALTGDAELALAVGNLTTQAAFNAAYRQLEPPSFGNGILRTALANQSLAFGALSHRLTDLHDRPWSTGDYPERHGFSVWVQEIGHISNQKDSASDPGYDTGTFGLAFGGDMPVLGLDALGFAFTGTSTEIDKDGLGGKPLVADSAQLSLYGSWSRGPLFVDAVLGAARNSYKSRRQIEIGDLLRTARAKWNGHQFSAGLTAGYQWSLGRVRITPSDSISYVKLHQKGYTEDGADGADFAVEAANASSLRNTAKLAIAYLHPMGDDIVKVEAHGAWVHDFSADAQTLKARFVDSGEAFTMTSTALDASEMQAGLTFGYLRNSSSLLLNYGFQKAGDYTGHNASLTYVLRF